MKYFLFILAILAVSSAVQAESVHKLQGSDTLAEVMTDAIIAAGLNKELSYTGGGSGKGESAMLNGDQGIAPMSRQVKSEAIAMAKQKGYEFVPYTVGLDGVGVFVSWNHPIQSIDIPTLAKIYTCEITQWEQVTGSGKSGAIKAYRRNDQSGTTDTFKNLVGVNAFGACVTIVEKADDISTITSNDASAIGYAGLSAKRERNKALSVAKSGMLAVEPTVANIRSFSYPLARKLYVYSVYGSRQPAAIEEKLMTYITDRSFLDPIIQANGFYTLD